MTNGRKIYRRYNVNLLSIEKELAEIYESNDYINTTKDRISAYISEHKDSEVYFSNGTYDVHISLDKKEQLLESYYQDLSNFSFEENVLGVPIAQWVFENKEENNLILPIYQNFTSILARLSEYSLADDLVLDVSEIKQIDFYLYPLDPVIPESITEIGNVDQPYATKEDYAIETYYVTIKNPEEIATILPNLISSDLGDSISANFSISNYNQKKYMVEIYVYPKVGAIHEEELQYSHYNYYGNLPAFLTITE